MKYMMVDSLELQNLLVLEFSIYSLSKSQNLLFTKCKNQTRE